MDAAELEGAGSEMRGLAETLVPLLLEGSDPRLATLRTQWQGAATTISHASAYGFYLDIAVPPGLPRVEVPDQGGGDASIPVAGSEHPSGCVLYVVDGALRCLEVYNVVAWEAPLAFGLPGEVQPIVLEPRAATST